MKPATRKNLAIALGVLFLSALIAGLLIPKLLDPDRYHNRIVEEIEKALGGEVRIGDISWGILRGLWLEVDGVEITGASAFPCAEGSLDISRVAYTDPSLWEKAIAGTETKITCQADLEADDLTVDNLEIKLGNLSLRARGSVLSLDARPSVCERPGALPDDRKIQRSSCRPEWQLGSSDRPRQDCPDRKRRQIDGKNSVINQH